MKSDINFEYIEDFADFIVDRMEDNEDLSISVVGKFEEIKYAIKEMMLVAEVDFDIIDLQSPDINDYTDEYILDCWCNDDVIQIGCEPAKRDGKYLNIIGDEVYLFDNCSSKIIPLCECSDLYYVNIYDRCDCDECCICEDSDIHGFTISDNNDNGYYTFSYHTSEKLTEKDIHSILKDFGF